MANGIIYIDSPVGELHPKPFMCLPPRTTPIIAPYWIDNDPSVGGNVSYEVHTTGSPLLRNVSDYISSNQHVRFTGTWMMVAYWWDVPELFLNNTVRQSTCMKLHIHKVGFVINRHIVCLSSSLQLSFY